MQPADQVVTGEAVVLELRLAGAGSRCVAALIDVLIMTVAQILVLVLVLSISATSLDAVLTGLILSEVLIVLGYPVAMETLWRGRTLGKAVMGLRVVRDDGGPIRFRHAFVRGLVGVVVDKPGMTYALGAFIPMVVRADNKRLGDMAAGTIVLQERVPGKLDAAVTMPPPLAGWAAGLELSAVDDALALRLRHFLARAAQLSPPARASLEHQLATEVVGRVGPPPAGTPAWALLSAILAERRRRAFAASQPAAPPWPSHQPTLGVPAPEPAAPEPEPAAPPPSGFAPPG